MPDTAKEGASDGENNGLDRVAALDTLFEGFTDAICLFSDITLVVDDGLHPVVKLEVSGSILAMVSDVFKAMLSEKFSEGQREEGQARKEIVVKDSPQGMRALCRMLHHLPPQDKDDKMPVNILELAIVADKYDCVEAIRFPVRGLLGNMMEPYRLQDCQVDVPLRELIAATFILDQPAEFRWLTHFIVFSVKTTIRAEDFAPESLDFLPPGLIASLNAQLNVARSEYTHHILELIEVFSKSAESLDSTHLIPTFLNGLRERNIFPLRHNGCSIGVLVELLEAIKVPLLKSDAPTCACKALSAIQGPLTFSTLGDDGDGWAYEARLVYTSIDNEPARWHTQLCTSTHFKQPTEKTRTLKQNDVVFAAQNVRDICVGACLDCCRSSKQGEESSCRMPHPKPWERSIEEVDVGLDVDAFRGDGGSRVKPEWWESTW